MPTRFILQLPEVTYTRRSLIRIYPIPCDAVYSATRRLTSYSRYTRESHAVKTQDSSPEEPTASIVGSVASGAVRSSPPDDSPELSLYVPAVKKKEREWMLDMHAQLEPYIAKGKPPPHEHSTLRKYYYRFKHAERKHGNGFRGLERRIDKRGNGNNKADPKSVALAKSIIREEHLTPTRSTGKGGYGLYVHACEEK